MQPSDQAAGSRIPHPVPLTSTPAPLDPYARLSFPSASPHRILRAHQRDVSQIQRLSDLCSELIRSAAGSRWLAARQIWIDTLVKMIYLALTLGRALPTLGEEYTDITPKVQRQARSSRARRYIAILLLVLPNILSPSVLLTWLKGDGRDDHMTPPPSGLKALTIRLLQSPFGQSLPELNTIAFLFGGRFLELGRRLTGLSYVSTTPNRSHEKQSYQPLGILLCLPLVFRLLSWYRHRDVRAPTSITDLVPLQGDDDDGRPMPSSATDVSTLSDQPNTYLSPTAQDIAERQCTLCLEPRGSGEGSAGTVAVTECGHAFCWGCLGNLDKPECPLCRQSLRMERLIAAYNL